MKSSIIAFLIAFTINFAMAKDNLELVKISPANVTLENGKSFYFSKGVTWAWDEGRLNFIGEMNDSFGSGLAGEFWLDVDGNLLITYVEFDRSNKFKLKKSELSRVKDLNWSLAPRKEKGAQKK